MKSGKKTKAGSAGSAGSNGKGRGRGRGRGKREISVSLRRQADLYLLSFNRAALLGVRKKIEELKALEERIIQRGNELKTGIPAEMKMTASGMPVIGWSMDKKTGKKVGTKKPKKTVHSAEGLARISAAQKARWAAKKKQQKQQQAEDEKNLKAATKKEAQRRRQKKLRRKRRREMAMMAGAGAG